MQYAQSSCFPPKPNPNPKHFCLMNSSLHLQRLTHLLLHNKTKLLSPKTLLQIHTQLLTTGLYLLDHSCTLSFLNLSISNPTTLHHATSLLTPPTWPFFIRQLALDTNGPFKVISLFKAMQRVNCNNLIFDPFVYASLIKACNKVLGVKEGKSIHGRVVRLCLDGNVNVLNSLVYFYMGFERFMGYACLLFDRMPERTVVTFNCMISGFLKNNEFNSAMVLFNQVLLASSLDLNSKPNYVTLVILISGCVEFERYNDGKLLHSYCWKMGLSLIVEVCNSLIDFYSKFGYMDDAARLFKGMVERDLVSWNTMIAGYARSNSCAKAFSLFREMRSGSIGYDRVSLVSLILASANSRDLDKGKVVHGHIKASGTELTVSLGAALINMYSKCGLIEFSRKVFDELPDENIASWNSMIHGYVECGRNFEAFRLFKLIKSKKLKPDIVTMLGLISACRNSGDLGYGVDIHSYIEGSDHLNGSTTLQNALIDMYSKCGSMAHAKTLFDKMSKRDVISWTSIIVGHAINGEGEEALVAFRQMCAEKVEPNSVTFLGVLSACDHAGLVEEGRQLYDIMCKVYHFEPGIEHFGCMVDMHARAGMLEEAHKFVKNMPVEANTVVWRMLLNACRVHGDVDLGLSLVSGLIEVKKLPGAEDHVISSNIFAEAGRWDDVLRSRSLMAAWKAQRVAGKSSISDLTD